MFHTGGPRGSQPAGLTGTKNDPLRFGSDDEAMKRKVEGKDIEKKNKTILSCWRNHRRQQYLPATKLLPYLPRKYSTNEFVRFTESIHGGGSRSILSLVRTLRFCSAGKILVLEC